MQEDEPECTRENCSEEPQMSELVDTSTDSQNDEFHSLNGSDEQFRSRSKPSVRSNTTQIYKNNNEIPEFYQSRASTTELCRICHDLDTLESFISPCRCRGSLSWVHRSCLERWLAESDTNHCELCGFRYRLQRLPKYGLLPSMVAWLSSPETKRERRLLLVDLIALLLITPLIYFVTIFAFELMEAVASPAPIVLLESFEPKSLDLQELDGSRDSLWDLLIDLGRVGAVAFVITLDLAFLSWTTIKLQTHAGNWRSWYRRNCKVTLLGYQDPPGPGE